MKVREAIEELQKRDPDAELHFCNRYGHVLSNTDEVEDIYDDVAKYGILTDNPKTVSIVVLDTSSCGL